MARVSSETHKLKQSVGIKDTKDHLKATKSYTDKGSLRAKHKVERQNRKRGRN